MLYLRPFSIKLHGRAVMQAPPNKEKHLLTFLLSLRLQVCHPTTRIFVALLGPCFKTGRLRQFCQQPFNSHLQPAVPDLTAKVLEVKPRPLIAKPNTQTTSKEPSSPHSQATWQKSQAITQPRTIATFLKCVNVTRKCCWLAGSAKEQPKLIQLRATIVSSVSLSAISRTISLSLQSAFHLSLTVLVRYRSLANI